MKGPLASVRVNGGPSLEHQKIRLKLPLCFSMFFVLGFTVAFVLLHGVDLGEKVVSQQAELTKDVGLPTARELVSGPLISDRKGGHGRLGAEVLKGAGIGLPTASWEEKPAERLTEAARISPETELADPKPLPATAGTASKVQDRGSKPQTLPDPALSNPLSTDLANQQLLMPLEKVREAFLAGSATLFLLRIQKAASSGLDVLFSTHEKSRECQPNMRRLERVNETSRGCNRLFHLLHYALDKEECEDHEGWDQPDSEWADLDCVPWVFSYCYQEAFAKLGPFARARLEQAFRSSRLVSGHFAYGLHRIAHRGAFTYVTSIREPLARVVSWWNWNAWRLPQHFPDLDFDGFLKSNELRYGGYQKSNHMVRVLCNERTGLRDENLSGEEGLAWGDDTALSALAEVTEAHYNCALEHLRKDFALVFLAEQIQEAVELAPYVSRVFNMKVVADRKPRTYNPTTYEEGGPMVKEAELAEATRLRILELNRWDVRLYEQARVLHKISIGRLYEMKDKLDNELQI